MDEQQIDIAKRLQAMRSLKFHFATNTDTAGGVVALVGVRVHHGVVDIVQIYGEHDADATRISGDETDILFPRSVLWRTTGPAEQVIDAVLDLPDPGQAQDAGGAWVPVSPGRSVWRSDDAASTA